jgi:hypothetical protein
MTGNLGRILDVIVENKSETDGYYAESQIII